MKQGGKLAGGNPARGRVENDFYATHEDSVRAILEVERILYPAWEPACGEGHISKIISSGGKVYSSDLVNRGYGDGTLDFLNAQTDNSLGVKTIITNPPFNLFQEFLEKALKYQEVEKIIFFGKLTALEGQKRASFLQKTPLKYVYVFKKRQQPMRNGKSNDEITGKKMSSTMAFAWFVWEIGYEGEPIIKWI
jgi:hypothetical protein